MPLKKLKEDQWNFLNPRILFDLEVHKSTSLNTINLMALKEENRKGFKYDSYFINLNMYFLNMYLNKHKKHPIKILLVSPTLSPCADYTQREKMTHYWPHLLEVLEYLGCSAPSSLALQAKHCNKYRERNRLNVV